MDFLKQKKYTQDVGFGSVSGGELFSIFRIAEADMFAYGPE